MVIQIENLENEIRNFIIEICENIGPRAPCSNNEAKCAGLFRDKFKNFSDEIHIEEFYTRPGAYKAAFRAPMILYLVSIIFYWHNPWLSLILATLSFLILFGEMSLTKEVIDFLFPKKTSQNVVGKIVPKNKAKELIIIGSHIDSNWEFPLMKKFGYGFAYIIAINLFLNAILLLMLALKIIFIFFLLESVFFNIEVFFFGIFISLIPIVLLQLFFMISNRPVMGANDNLSGLSVCYALAKSLSIPENKPKNIEVWIAAFGCEEIGSKGSKAFVTRHLKDIKKAKIINLDMIGCKHSSLLIGTSEIFGLVKTDKEIVKLIKESADNLSISVKLGQLMAFTDSLSFCRKNIPATSICSLPRSSKEFYYHTREDVIENLNFENLINTYEVLMDVIRNLDKK